MISFVLSAVGNGTGIYTGVFSGGASNSYAGMWVAISGFTNPANNKTTQITASTTTTITTTNTASVSETHAATATDATNYVCLDPGGFPMTVVTAATSTGSQWSTRFSVLDRPGGGPRDVWLQLGVTANTVSTFTADVLQSFDGGLTFKTLQSGIDLVGSPSQKLSPNPSVGAILLVTVDTLTGSGATVSVTASSN